ncbi:P-loop NTPase family protein [Streptomyces winkii]|uniref:hypothetical protein n=1 Tax=Streptomyces winkii TaxID=3051178 RepID=UPI0028D04134|nr:hypothetical protein [Streptomyces sp. DSM 40971]
MKRKRQGFSQPEEMYELVAVDDILGFLGSGFRRSSTPSPRAVKGAAALMAWMAGGPPSVGAKDNSDGKRTSDAYRADEPQSRTYGNILITGAKRVGKTSFIETLTDSPTVPMYIPHESQTHELAEFIQVGIMELDAKAGIRLLELGNAERACSLEPELLGSIGAVVILDAQRVDDGFPILESLEQGELSYVVAVNQPRNEIECSENELRKALSLSQNTPIVFCKMSDPRSNAAALKALIELNLKNSEVHLRSEDLEAEYVALCRLFKHERLRR